MTTDCPNCQHPQHLPGTECAARIEHGPSRWHLCLCLARPGAAMACPPQMTCQGGTLGYADIWYLQHGHSLSSSDGVISPEVLVTDGPLSVGFPPAPATEIVEGPQTVTHNITNRRATEPSAPALPVRASELLQPATVPDGPPMTAGFDDSIEIPELPAAPSAPADRAAAPDTALLHRLRERLAKARTEADRAHDEWARHWTYTAEAESRDGKRPPHGHFLITPHNGIEIGLGLAIFHLDGLLRQAGETPPPVDPAECDVRAGVQRVKADLLRWEQAAAPTPPADRAERRERYAAAMREHDLCTNRAEADADGNLPCRCGDWREPGAEADDENDWDSHLADAVMAVADAEQADLRTENARMRNELEVMYGGAFDKPADRAAVLRDGADAVAADTETHISYGSATDYAERHAALLRRMADEAQQAEKLPVLEPTLGEPAADPDVRRRETVEFFVESQQPDEAWESASSTDSRLGFIEERKARLQERFPEATFRIVQRTTTVLVEPLEDCPQCAWGVDHVEHCPHPESHNAGCGCAGDEPPRVETRRRCAHTDVVYGRCVRYLDDHDGECVHEHQPEAQQAGEGR